MHIYICIYVYTYIQIYTRTKTFCHSQHCRTFQLDGLSGRLKASMNAMQRRKLAATIELEILT